MSLLTVDDLCVRFGNASALNGVSLAVEAGEAVAVLGANGAGKTTLLRALIGRIVKAGGRVCFDGRDITHTRTDRLVALGLALCPEGRQLFPAMTVEDNLLLGAYLAAGREARRRLAEIYERFAWLRERRHSLAGSFSGGEQQIVAIGRALMAAPRLLLMDEPSSGLAPVAVEGILAILKDVRDAGTAMLLVEQNTHLAESIAPRCHVLSHGRVEASGETAAVVRDETLADIYIGAV